MSQAIHYIVMMPEVTWGI